MARNGKGARHPARPDNAEARRKSELAYRLFMARASYQQIADTADPERPGETLYADRSGAYRAVQAAIKRHAGTEETAELRRVQGQQINMLIRALWPKALGGQSWAVLRIKELMEHEAHLFGLYAPARARVEVITTDLVDAEIARLSAEIQHQALLDAADADPLEEVMP